MSICGILHSNSLTVHTHQPTYPTSMKTRAITLAFGRHAHAGQGKPDIDRNLSERGITQGREMGRILKRHVPHFDVVLASPATRTRQTAQLTLEAFPGNPANPVALPILYPIGNTALDTMFDGNEELEIPALQYSPLRRYRDMHTESGRFQALENWGRAALTELMPHYRKLDQTRDVALLCVQHAICNPMLAFTLLEMIDHTGQFGKQKDAVLDCNMGEGDILLITITMDFEETDPADHTITAISVKHHANPLSDRPVPPVIVEAVAVTTT